MDLDSGFLSLENFKAALSSIQRQPKVECLKGVNLEEVVPCVALSKNDSYVIAASGAVKHEDLAEQVKKLFTKLSSGPTITSELVAKGPAIFSGHTT
ncbi:hypothetical protein LOK49_LG10G01591 [Camellia lanceoleosa]|uniref:Uncharacterized protein n=1 Tax=Camellia lanceoleosa TaxID=1840588 RepID=A0ACC0GE07_9ERIC|nr:hypothetical protein LOK49_LG10G01591 [Camellia lanceoleosa]